MVGWFDCNPQGNSPQLVSRLRVLHVLRCVSIRWKSHSARLLTGVHRIISVKGEIANPSQKFHTRGQEALGLVRQTLQNAGFYTNSAFSWDQDGRAQATDYGLPLFTCPAPPGEEPRGLIQARPVSDHGPPFFATPLLCPHAYRFDSTISQ